MSRDSTFTYVHMHHSHHADLFESFTNPTNSHIPPEDIYIPPHLQPVNPEDEDDVVPDQHAAFGIQRATQGKKEPQWKDLGLEELLRHGPGSESIIGGSGGRIRGPGAGAGPAGAGASGPHAGAGPRKVGQTRREESVRVAMRRRPGFRIGVQIGVPGSGNGGDAAQGGGGGGAGNGLPR